MRHSWIARLRSLVVIVALAAGGSGLPILDAVLFHFHGAGALDPVRAEGHESGAVHGERCLLGAPLPVAPLASGPAPAASLDLPTFRLAELPVPPVRTAPTDLTARPRAPPASHG